MDAYLSFLKNAYHQGKNPKPEFTLHEVKKTLPFCHKLISQAEGFTSRFDFSVHVVFAHTQVKCHHMPLLLHYRAIDALPQEPYFYYDSLTGRARCSITNLVIIRATRALKFKAQPGLIIYQTEYTRLLTETFLPISPSAGTVLP
ncbi:TPA: hypothetical protein H1R55_004404 [Salmonella enterica]|nr:hypothetical protein [Salmonella enterica]